MGFFLYWIPFIACAAYYVVHSILQYRKDLAAREKNRINPNDGYYPQETVGSLVKRAILTVAPVLNILALAFEVLPKTFVIIDRIFDAPLVPRHGK